MAKSDFVLRLVNLQSITYCMDQNFNNFASLNLFISKKKRKFWYLFKAQGLGCWFHPSNFLLLLNWEWGWWKNWSLILLKKRIVVGDGKVCRRWQSNIPAPDHLNKLLYHLQCFSKTNERKIETNLSLTQYPVFKRLQWYIGLDQNLQCSFIFLTAEQAFKMAHHQFDFTFVREP